MLVCMNVCIYLCVPVCVLCMCMQVCMYVCACAWRPEVGFGCFDHSLSNVLGQGSHLHPELAYLLV